MYLLQNFQLEQMIFQWVTMVMPRFQSNTKFEPETDSVKSDLPQKFNYFQLG